MSYRSLKECVLDLEKHGHLIRVKREVDPELEMAEIHRRVYEAQGPALFFERVKGSPFPAVSNIYGTFERTEFIFRHTLARVQRVIELKADPAILAIGAATVTAAATFVSPMAPWFVVVGGVGYAVYRWHERRPKKEVVKIRRKPDLNVEND